MSEFSTLSGLLLIALVFSIITNIILLRKAKNRKAVGK